MTTAAAILFAVATAGVGIVGAQGYNADTTAGQQRQYKGGPSADIEAALEAGDYDAFIAAHPSDAPMVLDMTEEKFVQMQEMHDLREAGDTEAARALAKELGMPMRGGEKGMQQHKGMNKERLSEEARTAVDAALEAGDYAAFIAAHPSDSQMVQHMTQERFDSMVSNHAEHETRRAAVDNAIATNDYAAFVEAIGDEAPIREHITEDNFAAFSQVHQLHSEGEHEAARELAEEIGLEHPREGKKGNRQKNGSHRRAQ